ncbi:hypothetical protein [Chitinophaga sp. CF418]|uniref:hypothetical protein n=1 Tax=Chitinophaga sp. CF418 TaxID=1855287 RepID=UPI0009221FD1|nr:hypothetical protein [Chitinophaga sp. CF418]SHN44051.1 hypothetical protein SAMN05216311_116188 [Chitinophaga sp. CF418]
MKLFTFWLAAGLAIGVQQILAQSNGQVGLLQQVATTAPDSISKLPSKYLTRLSAKSAKMEHILNRQSDKALSRLNKLEQRIKRKLRGRVNPELLSLLSDSSYQGFTEKAFPVKGLAGNPYLDSLQCTFRFLGAHQELLSHSKQELSKAIKGINALGGELERVKEIKAFICNRKRLFQQQLSGYGDIQKYLAKYNKEAYYYSARIREYKSLLNDRSKIESKAQDVLRKLPAYKDFIKRNSALASFFNLPSATGAASSLEGLQNRSMIEALLQQRLGTSGMASQVMQQQMQTAQSQFNAQAAIPGITTIRNTISNQMSAARSRMNELRQNYPDLDDAAEMPNFTPSPLKAKRFWQRMEWGGNIQFQKSTYYFPATSDIAVQTAYLFHKNGSVGAGLTYQLGLGTDWAHIRFSHSGMGIRFFLDWRLKSTYFLNGGFELNRLSIKTVNGSPVDWHGWRTAALAGISKKYKINARLKGNIMVLYDFLAPLQVPKTNGLKVRFGYSL